MYLMSENGQYLPKHVAFVGSTNEYVYKTNKMRKILVIRLYFLLDALHVSDCISPSSGATL